eukprot:CAMPEP_0171340656 /NCGR_PEP_ID=MMETSP0878-20121228/8717_1 /TAXON_ID=67004 /ORGANISM="Thalassiosira weissflogii, Strain CCMP1336" /LENGTH=106 /DNA_ID=CAMNT_0011842769 /DNA_START=219 /DNA_END=539 /DNA_ORIENTATION=-
MKSKTTLSNLSRVALIWVISLNQANLVFGGPISCAAGIAYYGTCQTACNTGYVSCMAAAGLVAGTTGPVGWYAWLTSAPAGCSAVQGVCMATCAATAAGMCAAPAP